MSRSSSKKTFAAGVLSIDETDSPDQYFDLIERWLELEGDAERVRMAMRRQMRNQRDVERGGETLVKIVALRSSYWLGWPILVGLSKRGHLVLPMNRLRVGAPVVISDDSDPTDEGISGVVSRRSALSIQVATEQWPTGREFRIDLSPDETTRRRQLGAMNRMRNASGRTRNCEK